MSDDSSQMGMALPRPGKVLKAVLVTLAAVSVVFAVVVNWLPGGDRGNALFAALTCVPGDVMRGQVWRVVTSGLLTNPVGLGHTLFTLMGLYFLGTDLERRWGGARLLRLLVIGVVAGNALAILVDRLAPPGMTILHPPFVFGPEAALVATAIAWSRENPSAKIRLFFFLPLTGRQFLWLTLGFCLLGFVYFQGQPEGVVAPFGGAIAGLALGGTPSPLRSLYLRIRLSAMRRQGSVLTVESLLDDRSKTKKRKEGPPLRVVYGGLEDGDKKKGPKDKRWLN